MTSKYKLIVFDLDGTLINSVADLASATNYALAYYGLPQHPVDSYRYFVGNGVNILFLRALPESKRTEEWVSKMREIMLPYYAEHCIDLTKPYPKIIDLLQEIELCGIKMAVASNKYQAATTPMVKHFFPTTPFVATLGQREGVPTKPDPTIVEDILKIACVDKSKVLYVGDTAVDMQTGRNSGLTTVGVTWGFRPRAELESEAPDFIVDTVDELRQIIFA